jgi:hypothetical protein
MMGKMQSLMFAAIGFFKIRFFGFDLVTTSPRRCFAGWSALSPRDVLGCLQAGFASVVRRDFVSCQ